MRALILAAGYGVRLYPLTKNYPKPLLPVGKKPIIEYTIDKLLKVKGLDEIIIVTNNKFYPKFRDWLRERAFAKPIRIVNDLTKNNEERLGAVGDINFVIQKNVIKDDLLVIGGDNIFDGDLCKFVSFAKKKKVSAVIGVYDIKQEALASHFGVVRLDKDKHVADFREKPLHPDSTLIAMCLYYFPRGQLRFIGKYLTSCRRECDAAGFYIDWLRKKGAVYGYVFKGEWYDIGHLDAYASANQKFLKQRRN